MQQLVAEKRLVFGKKVENLREKGFLPAVIYGGKEKSEALSVSTRDFIKVWKKAGESTLVDLKIEGGKARGVLIQDVVMDPIKSRPLHVDFYEVAADRLIKTNVQLEFVGESAAVKSLGGILIKVMHEVEVEALPKDLPHALEVDLSALKTFDDTIVIKDIVVSKGVTIHAAPDATIAKVTPPRTSEELANLETPAEINLEAIEVEKKGKKEETSEDEAASSGE